jgi:hypothetical protein
MQCQRQGTLDTIAGTIPRLHDSAEDTILNYSLSYFLNTVCRTGQQRGISLLMCIIDIVTGDVASQARELAFMLVFQIVSRSSERVGKKWCPP